MARPQKQLAKRGRPAAPKATASRGPVKYLGPPPGDRTLSTEQIRKAVESYLDARGSGK